MVKITPQRRAIFNSRIDELKRLLVRHKGLLLSSKKDLAREISRNKKSGNKPSSNRFLKSYIKEDQQSVNKLQREIRILQRMKRK